MMSLESQLIELPSQRSKDIIQEIINNSNIQEYEISATQGSQKGDNYMSDVFRIKIRSKSKDLDLIMKLALPTLDMRSVVNINKLFKREIFVYTELLPIMYKLQEDYGIKENDRFRYAKLYKGCDEEANEMLVMEDLSATGFRMHDRHHAFDFDHASLCIKTLARTHACGIVLKDKAPAFYKSIQDRSTVMTDFGDIFKALVENSKPSVLQECEGEPYYDKMVKFYENAYDELTMMMETETSASYDCICHGDSWCNNFLFKYENDKVVAMRMVDWQIIRVSSPVHDISYMLFLSTDKELRAKHYNELLNMYYDTLSSNVSQMGVDITKYYPEHIYREHIKKFMMYGFIIAVTGMQVILGEKYDAVDLPGIIGNQTKFVTNDRTKKRVKDLIEDGLEYGIL